MNNDALVAALGMDAVAAVAGYRSAVVSDAARRGLLLVSGSLSGLVRTPVDVRIVDPLDIGLTFGHGDLAGRALVWNPADGWSLRCPPTHLPVRYYAGERARALDLVPFARDVMDWAIADLDGAVSHYSALPPVQVNLDDDLVALHRLIEFIDSPRRIHAYKAFRMPDHAHRMDRRPELTPAERTDRR